MPSSQDDSTDCERQTEDIRRALSPVAPTAPPRPGLEWVRPCYGWALAALVAVIVISGWTRIALTQNATVTLNSTADATVKQGTPNSNQGAETLLRIQQSGSNRALVRFDQQALEQAIGSASVRSAKLRLFVVANGNNWGSEGREVNVHRLTQPWTELGATWNCPNDTNTSNSSPDCNPGWEMGGRSLPPFAVAPTQVILHQNGQTGWVEWDVTADVRKFLDQEWSNYGWIVRKDDEGAAGQVDYASREGTNTPRLVVELGEPPQPPAAGGLTAVSDADVRSGSPNQNQGNRMRLQVQSSGNNRVLVQFDRQAMLATVGNGALQNAKLRLYVISNANNWGSSGRIVNVHRIAQAWTEQGSTWNCPNDLNPFNSQADCTPTWNMSNSAQWPFVGTATGSLVQQNNQTGWVEWDVTGDVAQILGGSVPNYGWLIRKDNESQTGQVEYGSRESPHKPELRLTVQANNQAPQVSAGTDQTITLPGTASLAGSASDDGLPSGSALTYQWSQTGGPGTASFNNPASAATVVSFDVPGTYVLRLTVSDSQLTGTDEMTVVVNPPPPVNQAPQVSAGPDQTITLPATATLTGSASDDGLPAGSMLVVSWSKVSGPGTASFDNSGSRVTAVTFSAAGTYQLRLTATDSALSTSDDVSVTVNPGGPVLPPDPVSVAPPLDRTVVTTVFKASEFLYSGTNPIQTGVAPGTITPIRAAVLRGRVITREGQPLSGVRISVSSHPELGQTLSRGDGMFDLAVNGGGLLTVGYEKAGLLPVHRQVNVPWQDYRSLPSVALVPLDAQVSTVAAGAAAIQVHQANVVTDSDGSRRATLLFPAGTTATMELPGGGAQPLNTMQVRATEYTVGPNGPLAMPATLPANSFYTYCVELSVDEAIAANAHSVRFSQPVVKYVDNFLGVAVGTIVPEGYYDRQKAQWVASTSGRVVQILSVVDSQAILDVDGSGSAATPEAMAALRITGTERLKLAELYAPG